MQAIQDSLTSIGNNGDANCVWSNCQIGQNAVDKLLDLEPVGLVRWRRHDNGQIQLTALLVSDN